MNQWSHEVHHLRWCKRNCEHGVEWLGSRRSCEVCAVARYLNQIRQKECLEYSRLDRVGGGDHSSVLTRGDVRHGANNPTRGGGDGSQDGARPLVRYLRR